MLFKKLLRTMGQYKAQFISMVIMIGLGIGVFVGFNMEWVSIIENTDYVYEKTNFSDYRIVSETGFSKDAVSKISEIDGVDAASRFISVNVDVKDRPGDLISLAVTENFAVSSFMVMSGEEYDPTSKDGIWLSDQYAAENAFKVGDELVLKYGTMEISGKIKGLIKASEFLICLIDDTQIMPNFEQFGFAYISPAMYETVMPFVIYPQINVLSDLDKDGFTEKVYSALDDNPLIVPKDDVISYSEAMGEADEGKTMGVILPVVFLLIAVLTMITTMHRLTSKEKTQIGTLKALGFHDKKIMFHYTSYALMIGILGSAVGIGIGYFLAWFIMNPKGSMGAYLDLPEWRLPMPWFCVAVIIAVIILLTVIGFLSVRKHLQGTAAEALSPDIPQNIKSLAIEKLGLFDKASFGVRWNLRDSMRHKSRTLMSLLGVMGCTMIIIATLGMADTLNAFLDIYYDDSTFYASRIFINENADRSSREAVVTEYDGDWNGSISIQIDGEAYLLDIYHLDHKLIRFPDGKDKIIDLGDDGAYLCRRIADQYGLSAGDIVTINPYGSDEQYTLKIAGVVGSLSKNISMTTAYADSVGIAYNIDYVYTTTAKDDIAPSDIIKSVQTKESIIESFNAIMDLLDTMVTLLLIAAIILGVVVLYNLGVMSYTERYREMATLKVLGFRDNKIGRILIGQNLWVSVIGTLLGIPLGIWILDYLLHALAGDYEMELIIKPLSYLWSAAITLGVSLIVSIMISRKNKKIDMVEALKGTE